MGDCYFLKDFISSYPEQVNLRNQYKFVIRSEDLGEMLDKYPILQRLLNSTCGIWYYENNLKWKNTLQSRLMELIDKISENPELPFLTERFPGLRKVGI